MAGTGVPIDQWSGSGSTDSLHTTIKELNRETSQQTAKMIKLTVTMKWLTIVMTIGLFVQIVLALMGKC